MLGFFIFIFIFTLVGLNRRAKFYYPCSMHRSHTQKREREVYLTEYAEESKNYICIGEKIPETGMRKNCFDNYYFKTDLCK